jgi:polysaccharide biosynthesis protein PslH
MRILFLSRWFPFPTDNGSKLRIYNLLRVLATRHQVDLISFYQGAVTSDHLDAMHQVCCNIEIIPYKGFNPVGLSAGVGYFSRFPRSVKDTYNFHLEEKVDQLSKENHYDAVIASEIDMAPYARLVKNAVTVLEELELRIYYDRYQTSPSLISKIRSGISWWKYKNYIKYLLDNYQCCTVVSQAEADLAQKLVPGYRNFVVIPNGINPQDYKKSYGTLEPDSLVYAGSLTYDANFDAVSYFLGDIFSLIQSVRPHVKLYVTGRQDPGLLSKLPYNEGVIYTGYLDNVQPRIAQSWVSIVPLRMGGGTRLKILESLILRTPVVSTSKGVEGLKLEPEKEILVRDKADEFAQAVIDLLDNQQKRDQLSKAGYQAVFERYSWEQIGNYFLSVLDELSIQFEK